MIEALVGWPATVWRVVFVPCGGRYGRGGCLTADEGLVEFFDLRLGEPGEGHFVSRYHAATIAAHMGGINLHGASPSWQMSAEDLASVLEQLRLQGANI